jgi:hypothetical protein
VTHLYALHPCCAELVNTVTNVCAFSAAMIGLRRALTRRLPASFVFTEAVLAVVAVGSTIFHATRSYYAEMLDEFPMSVMAYVPRAPPRCAPPLPPRAVPRASPLGTCLCLQDRLHVGAQGQALADEPSYWHPFFASYAAAVCCAWVLYATLHSYHIFTTCFTLQVCPAPVLPCTPVTVEPRCVRCVCVGGGSEGGGGCSVMYFCVCTCRVGGVFETS